jgi:hypothetical protein
MVSSHGHRGGKHGTRDISLRDFLLATASCAKVGRELRIATRDCILARKLRGEAWIKEVALGNLIDNLVSEKDHKSFLDE